MNELAGSRFGDGDDTRREREELLVAERIEATGAVRGGDIVGIDSERGER